MTEDADLSTKLKEEKSSSLKVLEGVVGKSNLDRFSEKISKNTKKIIDMNSVRFDPTKMSSSPALLPTLEKKKVSNSMASLKLQQKQAPDSAKLQKKEENISDVAMVDDSTKSSKVDPNKDSDNDQIERELKKNKKSAAKK
ncbi:hypothetical protein ElyMa_005650200 [Elysia marginata]|uniref:Uncharacterized protein n=1 Tax=Elysia marginata TaxID=1093978 RepID=A0AAV4FD69_9GAST|nr:hypothetical protein ElyMa_005650200 [Elysia marginata]